MFGIIDSGSDITIMGGELFKKVPAAARLKEERFPGLKQVYDKQPFTLDGSMNLDMTRL